MAYLYTVVLRTAYVDGAGTNADVEIQIKGQSATSQWYVLDNPEDDREKGSQNIYKLYNSTHLGNINGVTLRVKKADEDRPEWCLAEITLVDHDAPHGTVTYVYDCGNVWICPSSYTEWVYYSPESVAQSSSPSLPATPKMVGGGAKNAKGCFLLSIQTAYVLKVGDMMLVPAATTGWCITIPLPLDNLIGGGVKNVRACSLGAMQPVFAHQVVNIVPAAVVTIP